MRWLLHGPLTSAVAEALTRHRHTAQSPIDVGLSDQSSPAEVVKTAHQKQLDVLTSDANFVNALFESPVKFDRSLDARFVAGAASLS